MSITLYILVGFFIGFIASRIKKLKGSGLVAYIVIGGAGGLLGGWLFTLLTHMGIFGNLIMACVVSILILWITTFLIKP